MVQLADRLSPSMAEARTDADLCALARQGSEQAYATIIRRYNGRLFRIARSILRNDAEAEDAVQDAYVRAFLSLGELRDAHSLSTWLGRIAANEALGRLRRRRPVVGLEAVENKHSFDDEIAPTMIGSVMQENPEAATAHKEISRVLETAIDGLPTHFRMVFVGCAIDQMSIEEAAECFGLPVNTVKTRLHRAKRLLRRALGAEFANALPDVFAFAGARCDRITARVLARLKSAAPLSGG